MNKEVALIGYSGHAFVVANILLNMGRRVAYYCDVEQKKKNPYNLEYLGNENDSDVLKKLNQYNYALAVGDNSLREKLFIRFKKPLGLPLNTIHPHTSIGKRVSLGNGLMIGPGAVINAQSYIGDGVICNTGCIIEHECKIGKFSHIAPSATLLGNVEIGRRCLIGGNTVIKPGISIGDDVTIGAGAVVLKNFPDGVTVAGNPARNI